MNIKKSLILITLLLLLPLAAWAQQGTVKFDSIAEIEVEVVNEQGKKVLARKVADRVVPGTIVIYTNELTNQGDAVIEAPVIDNPVPDNTEYLMGSAMGADAAITFSVDGGATYDVPAKLMVTDANGQKVPAEAKDYTHIRWQLANDLPPGGTTKVEFRAKVK